MTQEILRQKFQAYHDVEGITFSHIAKQIGISAGFFCDFMKGRKQLGEAKYQQAIRYYNSKEKITKEDAGQ